MARNPVSWLLSSVNARILLTAPSNFLQQMGTDLSPITKLLHGLHFTNTFRDQNLYEDHPISSDNDTIKQNLFL